MNVRNEHSDLSTDNFDDLLKQYELFKKEKERLKKQKFLMPNIKVHDALSVLWYFNHQGLSFYDEKTLPILLSVAVNSTLQLLRSNKKNGKVASSKYEEDLATLKQIIQFFKPINKDDPLESTVVYDFTNLELYTIDTNSLEQIKALLQIYNQNLVRKKKWWRTRYTHWGGKRARLHKTKKRRKKMNGPRKNSFYQ